MTEAAKVTDGLAAFEAVDEWDEFAVLALKAGPELWEQIAEIAEKKFANGRVSIERLRLTQAKPPPFYPDIQPKEE